MIKFEDVKNVPVEEYFNGNRLSIDIFKAKYVHMKSDNSLETPAEVFYRVASEIAKFESDEKFWAGRWFDEMYSGWWRPGGSVLSGVGSFNKVSLANCTTIPLESDSLEGISKCMYSMMKCAAYRQGLGVDVSVLRPRGASVNNSAVESTGAVSWMDFLQQIGSYTGQKSRKPAILLSLKINHPDVEEFISCKDDLQKINNANISVQITDDFMEAVQNDLDYKLEYKIEEHDQIIIKTVKARELFRKIAQHAWKTAEPGVQFIDLMKNSAMQEALYKITGDKKYEIISTNACSEKPLSPYSICNLLSINMEKFSTDEEEYKNQLFSIAESITRFSDNVIQYELDNNRSPLPEQKEIVSLLREIGCGVTNCHAWLLKQDLAYDSDEAVFALENFMMNYSHGIFESSIKLGKEKGNAPAFDELNEIEDLYYNSEYFKNMIDTFYKRDPLSIINLRNLSHVSIAPTGTISMSFPTPCLSSGIEPVIGLYYWRRTRALTGEYLYYFIIPDKIKEYVISKIPGDSLNDAENLNTLKEFPGSILDSDGKIGLELISIIEQYIPKGFIKPAHEIDPFQKIKMMGRISPWVDAAISCTYNLAEDIDYTVIEKIYMEAWLAKIKAVSVYREGSREGILIFEDPKTNEDRIAQMMSKKSICEKRPKTIQMHCSPSRPIELNCDIHHCSVKGKKWIVLVGLLGTELYEIFAGEYDEEIMYIPGSVKSGVIKKRANGEYQLIIPIRKTHVKYDNIGELLMNSEYRSLTRLISLNLRHGVPHEFIIDQLRKSNEGIVEFSSVVSRVLSKYIKKYSFYNTKTDKCPECGREGTLVRGESCLTCIECGWSKCE